MSEHEFHPPIFAAEIRALHCLVFSVVEATAHGWAELAWLWRLRLRPETRKAIAITALLSCEPRDRRDIVAMLKHDDPFDGTTAPDPFEEDAAGKR